MTRARDIADLVDANGDIVAGALDNVPASNDASALTTGTLAAARLPSSGISASAVDTGTLPDGILPAGCVLQIVTDHTWIPSEIQVASGNSYNFPTLSITPKSSSSSLIFFSNPRFYSRSGDRSASTNGYGNTYIYIDDITNSANYKQDEWINYADNNGTTDGLRLRYPVLFTFSNTVTTQRQFRTRAEVQSGSIGRIGGEGYISQMIVEVE